jgi:hypothetical protein
MEPLAMEAQTRVVVEAAQGLTTIPTQKESQAQAALELSFLNTQTQ